MNSMDQNNTLDELKKDMSDIKDILENKTERTVEHAKDKMANFLHPSEMRTLARNLGCSIRNGVARSKQYFYDAKDQCQATVEQHPFAALATTFAGGLLIASFLRRR